MQTKKRFFQSHKILFTVILVIAAAIAIYAVGYLYYTYHFFPGSTVNGVDVGGMTAQQAADAASEDLSTYVLTVTGKDTSDSVSAAEIGLSYDFGGNAVGVALDRQEAANWPSALVMKNAGNTATLTVEYDEDLLRDAVSSFSCVNPDEPVSSQNACYSYADGQYQIIPEVEGNQADADAVYQKVAEAVAAGETEISVVDCYDTPAVTSDDELLNQIVDAANLILSSNITVSTAYHSVTLDADSMQSFLVIDDEAGTVDIDEDLVYDWVNTNISGPNYTVGTTRTVQTVSSGEITVSGGTYGNWVNVQEETDQIISELKEGATVNREPAWRISEISTDNGGIGYTYIDVNIDEQTVYYVVDNEIVYSTPCVSGLPNGERDTDLGCYSILRKVSNYYMRENDVTVNYWLPINDTTGIGLHDATWRSSFGGSIYKTNGSHGCINLSLEAAEWFYENVEVGTPVLVH